MIALEETEGISTMSRQKTFEVTHEGTHYPTNRQMHAALDAALKDEGVKIDGDVDYFLVENTSGGTSKVRATFESEPVSNTGGGSASADARNAKPEAREQGGVK